MTDWTPELQRELIEESERIFQAEQAEPDDAPLPDGVVITQPNRGRSVVYSIRLLPEQIERIERVAEQLGVPASTVVRGWVQLGLADAERDPVSGAVERLEADVRRLRRAVRGRAGTGRRTAGVAQR